MDGMTSVAAGPFPSLILSIESFMQIGIDSELPPVGP